MDYSAEYLLELLKNNAEIRGIYSAVCKKDFKSYILLMFYLVNGTKYKLKPFHMKVMKALQDLVDGKNTKRNLALCLPVGAGKSILVEYFITWCFARSVDNMFVYTAYSDRLINKLSKETKDIIENPAWQLLFQHFLKKDDRQKINYSFQGAKNRTGLTAGTMSSALTGLDAGVVSVEGFSGALICFPYGQEVWTNKGVLKIGDIVENKLDVEVFSYNHSTKNVELKPIEAYVKNKGDDIVRVTMQDGNYFECTKNHRVWTQNRGYIEAKDLIGGVDKVISLSDSFNLMNRQTCDICNNLSGVIPVPNQLKSFFIKTYLFAWCVLNIASKALKRLTSFNSLYSSHMATKGFSNLSIASRIARYCHYILLGKFTPREHEGAVFNSVLHIFRFSPISKIFKTIIKFVRIKMSGFKVCGSFTNKCEHNKAVDSENFAFSKLRERNHIISMSIYSWFKRHFFEKVSSTFSKTSVLDPMTNSSNNSRIRNLIQSLVVRDVFVDNVCFIGHNHNSYCLTVHDNHNMFVGKSQAYLVKNCDDPSSADEIQFPNARETVIRTYDDKLATRRRTPTTPTILIMQRLHVDDLVGWTKKNEPDQWEYVEVPALDENDKSFWEERYPAEELKRIREINPYKFQAQYQQNPIVAGGQMIKSEWFQFYQSHPKYTRIFITSDTAMKTGQHNDYSVFMVWGVYQHSIYLIDMVRGKWEAPELLRQIRDLTNRYWLWENRLKMSALYIEDKASGVGLIQQMKRESRVPIIPLTPTKDKVSRVEEALPFLQAGRVFLPFNREYGQNPVIIGECEMFARDLSHTHDDVTDTLVYGIQVSSGLGRVVSIFET